MVKAWQEVKCFPVPLCWHLLPWLDSEHTFTKDVRLVLYEGVGKHGEGVDWRSLVVAAIRKLPSVLLVHLPVDVNGEQPLLMHNTVSLASHHLNDQKTLKIGIRTQPHNPLQ